MANVDIKREKAKWRLYVEQQLSNAGLGIILATDAELNDATSAINTDGRKEQGLEVYNTDQELPVWATGSGATDTWISTSSGNAVVNTPIIANEVDTEIAATNPFLDYAADEASGQYISQGSSALALEIDPQFGNTQIWRQAPGVIRSTPIQYSFMHPATQQTMGWSNPTVGDANLPDPVGWTTGGFACFMMRFGEQGDDCCPMSFSANNGGVSLGSSQATRFEVNINGRLFFLIGTGQTGSVGGSGIRIETGDGVIDVGTPYHIAAIQRADGNGIQILVNGVVQAVTRTLGSSPSINIDSWLDDWQSVSTNDTAQVFAINGYASGITTSFSYLEDFPGLTQRPLVWRNNPPTDQQILDIHDGALLNNPVSDYCEYLIDEYVATNDPFHLTLGWLLDGNEHINWGYNVQVTDGGTHGRWQWSDTKQTENDPDTFRTSRWPLFRTQFEANGVGGQAITSGGSSALNSRTQGTVNMVCELPASITIGQSRPLWAWGEGISGPDENVGVFLAGNSFGTSVVFLIGEFTQTGTTTGDFFRRTWAAADVGLTLADFPDAQFMLTIVQDGVSVALYMNGVEVTTFVDSNTGTTYDETGWFEQLVNPGGSLNFSAGYPGSNNHPDNMWISEKMILQDRVLTGPEVLAHWNAINGTF